MGILDDFKDLPGRVKGLLQKKVNTVRPMNICMLGPRGVGKTSIITSMYQGQKQAVAGTNLFLVPESSTASQLNNKIIELKNIFTGARDGDSRITETGIAGDSTETLFEFKYGMNTEPINIGIEIRDYPGEYLLQAPDAVADYIADACAVLVAIDTPCLMECGGRYNKAKNRPELVTDFLKKHLSNAGNKLILLVPLKCEKYFLTGRIDEVTQRVMEVYAELLEFLRDRDDVHGFKKKICCAITPIQTLGSVAFDSFATDGAGRVIELATRDGLRLPGKVLYRFTSPGAGYSPLYCEQPLYYLLSFFSKQYRRMQEEEKNSGWLNRIKNMFQLIPNADAFILEIEKLGQGRKLDGDGFKLLFGRGRI